MKTSLNATTLEILHYIKSKLIRDRMSNGMAVNIGSPEL
jgi:hypothetical protein